MTQELHVKIQHPATVQVVAPTSGGKTTLVRRLVRNLKNVFEPVPRKVFWHYNVAQPWFRRDRHLVNFVKGLPDVKQLDARVPQLVIIDDFMSQTNKEVENFFTCYSHHYNTSVIFISQNLFFNSSNQKTMSNNTQYYLLLKSVRDKTQIKVLGGQMFPGNSGYLLDAHKKATDEKWGYLLVDLKPYAPDDMRLCTKIFPGEIREYFLPLLSDENAPPPPPPPSKKRKRERAAEEEEAVVAKRTGKGRGKKLD